MKECQIIRDLWPLYLDDELSEDSRKFVEDHLAQCRSCQQELRKNDQIPELKGALPCADQVSDPGAKFLHRLRKRSRRITAGVLAIVVLLVATVGYGAWQYGEWSAAKRHKELLQQEIAFYEEQLVALENVSPTSEELMARWGIRYSLHKAVSTAKILNIEYQLQWDEDSPVEYVIDGRRWFEKSTLSDSMSGQRLQIMQSGAASDKSGYNKTFEALTPDNKPLEEIVLTSETLYAFMKGQAYSFDFAHKTDTGTTAINQKYVFGDVEFIIDAIEVDQETFKVIYRQLTPASDVGVFLLTFAFDDRLGNTWTSEPYTDLDVRNPREFVMNAPASPSKSWRLQVHNVVQVIPGMSKRISLERSGHIEK